MGIFENSNKETIDFSKLKRHWWMITFEVQQNYLSEGEDSEIETFTEFKSSDNQIITKSTIEQWEDELEDSIQNSFRNRSSDDQIIAFSYMGLMTEEEMKS